MRQQPDHFVFHLYPGGGLEYAVTRNWTVRAEYLYVNLGNTSLTETVGSGVTPGFTPSAIGAQYTDFALRILRVGANLRF